MSFLDCIPLRGPIGVRFQKLKRALWYLAWIQILIDDSADSLIAIGADNTPLDLCRRRQWPQPHYESYCTNAGYACVARVNNREYQTDTTYGSDLLARENAAMRAYLICRNFSVNDGMYPSGHAKGPVIQGLPVAIGTERRSAPLYTEYHDNGSRSGGSSPRSYESNSSYGDSRRTSRRISTGRALRYEDRHY
ncbi:MAG: hypothetical protein Q9181_004864 [Wetmoreana brouardii]